MGKKKVTKVVDNRTWAIIELMGHVRMAGVLTEEERFGTKMGRVDIPQLDGSFVTQYFGGGSVYRITPCTEATARAAARTGVPAPIQSWEIPKEAMPKRLPAGSRRDYDEEVPEGDDQ